MNQVWLVEQPPPAQWYRMFCFIVLPRFPRVCPPADWRSYRWDRRRGELTIRKEWIAGLGSAGVSPAFPRGVELGKSRRDAGATIARQGLPVRSYLSFCTISKDFATC